jgi:hypothetical protein
MKFPSRLDTSRKSRAPIIQLSSTQNTSFLLATRVMKVLARRASRSNASMASSNGASQMAAIGTSLTGRRSTKTTANNYSAIACHLNPLLFKSTDRRIHVSKLTDILTGGYLYFWEIREKSTQNITTIRRPFATILVSLKSWQRHLLNDTKIVANRDI